MSEGAKHVMLFLLSFTLAMSALAAFAVFVPPKVGALILLAVCCVFFVVLMVAFCCNIYVDGNEDDDDRP